MDDSAQSIIGPIVTIIVAIIGIAIVAVIFGSGYTSTTLTDAGSAFSLVLRNALQTNLSGTVGSGLGLLSGGLGGALGNSGTMVYAESRD